MCVHCRPTVCVVGPNHEVVGFQPLTVTAANLGSVTNSYTYYIPPVPLFPTVFWIFVPTPPQTYLISSPHLSPVDSASLSPWILFRHSHKIEPLTKNWIDWNRKKGFKFFKRIVARNNLLAYPDFKKKKKTNTINFQWASVIS